METLDAFLSDVVLGKTQSSDLGYTSDSVTVTWSDGMEAGAALELVAGKYIWVVALNVANTVAILADVEALPSHPGYADLVDATDYTMTVVKRGVTVNKNKVTLADSVVAADITAASAAFEAAGANKVTDKFFS